MKIELNRKKLLTSLQLVAPAVHNDNIYPICQNVLFDNGKITATNTVLTIQSEFAFPFKALIKHKLLTSLLQLSTEETIYIDEDAKSYILYIGSNKHTLGKINDYDIFPAAPEVSTEQRFNIGEKFFTYLQNAAKCETQSDQYPTHGVLVSDMIFATNLSVIYTAKTNLTCRLHVPSDFIRSCSDIKEGVLSFTGSMICIKSNGLTVMSKMIDKEYPQVAGAIPNEIDYNLVVGRDDLIGQLNLITAYGHPLQICDFVFQKNDELYIKYRNKDFEHESADLYVPCKHEINQEPIHLSVPELIRILQCQESGELQLRIEGNKAVCIKSSNNENILSLIGVML